jgi:hypothetical protein
MKSTKTLVLAASILALTLTAFPHVAAAGTGAAPQQASSDLTRKGGEGVKYMAVILAAGNLISLLVL